MVDRVEQSLFVPFASPSSSVRLRALAESSLWRQSDRDGRWHGRESGGPKRELEASERSSYLVGKVSLPSVFQASIFNLSSNAARRVPPCCVCLRWRCVVVAFSLSLSLS